MGMIVRVPVRLGCSAMLGLRRRVGGMSFLTDSNVAQPQVAEERHKPQPEHVEGSKTGGKDSDQPEKPPGLPGGLYPRKHLFFNEEAPERREDGESQPRTRCDPER